MMRAVLWLGAIVLAVALTVLAFAPAAWLGDVIERQTGGRLTLGDAQGTLWRGSAFIGGAPGPGGAVTPLLPGRFAWTLSPLALLGSVEMTLDNPLALSQPVRLSGGWSQWQLSPAALLLPAQGLAGLGAPLNTLALSGEMTLSWTTLGLATKNGGKAIAVDGVTTLELNEMGSRMAPIKVLGSYKMTMDWQGQQAQLNLKTERGALLLAGKGSLNQGRFQFSGTAQAADGYEETLGNLLNLLGQRRMVDGKKTIALEFK